MSPQDPRARVYHGKWFQQPGTMIECECGGCAWTFGTRSRSSATTRAKEHVLANPTHVVATRRMLVKITAALGGEV